MTAHKAAPIYITADAIDATLTSVLPHGNLAIVCHHGFVVGIHGNHYLILVNLALQVLVVEVATGIDEWLLLIGFFHKVEEVEQGIAEDISRQAASALHINHRNKVLLLRNALRLEIAQLLKLVGLGAIEMVAAHLETLLMGHPDVALKGGINAVATLSSLQIDISHVGIVAQCLPEHLALIVAEVDAMNMGTGVFALHIVVLRREREGQESK